MECFFENHEIPYNLRCGSAIKLPGTNTKKIRNKFTKLQRCNVVECNTKKNKLFRGVTRIYEKVKETLDTLQLCCMPSLVS